MSLTLTVPKWIIAISAVTFVACTGLAHRAIHAVDVAENSDSTRLVVGPSPTRTCIPDWQVVPTTRFGIANGLYGVAAVSANDIWAVGDFIQTVPGYDYALILHWDGTQWTRVPGPGTGMTGSRLNSVAAISSSDVWAVGYADSGTTTLTLHWDGSEWTRVPTPSIGTGQTYLQAVAAIAPNDVWAVGDYNYPASQTLALHWDGMQWTQVNTPNLSSNSALYGVTTIATNDAWAVGYYRDTGGYHSVTIHWDGATWTLVPSPTGGGTDNALVSVSAVASNDVWAVGSYLYGSSVSRGLILRWDGTQWVEYSVPDFPNGSRLSSVAAVTANDAWAVGDTAMRSLVLHWNGISWEGVPFSVGEAPSTLKEVAAISADDVWAVGVYNLTSKGGWTLSVHYAGQCATYIPTPTSTITRTRTPTSVSTSTPSPTPPVTPSVPATSTLTATASATPCPIRFSDLSTSDYFYEAVRYLYCAGIISGYADGTFKPYNNTTRGQLCKIVVLGEGFTIYTPPTPTFRDVPANDTFYSFVETAYAHGIISGYSCGSGCLEFRPGNNVTRGQLCKIIVLAEGWTVDCPPTGHFSDVPPANPFFCFVETAYEHGIISGYSDHTFRPGNNATRGQICKIVYSAITAH